MEDTKTIYVVQVGMTFFSGWRDECLFDSLESAEANRAKITAWHQNSRIIQRTEKVISEYENAPPVEPRFNVGDAVICCGEIGIVVSILPNTFWRKQSWEYMVNFGKVIENVYEYELKDDDDDE